MDICVIKRSGSVVYERISVSSEFENTGSKEVDDPVASMAAGVNGFGNSMHVITPAASPPQKEEDRWNKILHDTLKL
jgi:hypothetical protein